MTSNILGLEDEITSVDTQLKIQTELNTTSELRRLYNENKLELEARELGRSVKRPTP